MLINLLNASSIYYLSFIMDKIKKGSTYSVLGWITSYVSEVSVGGYPTRIKILSN